MIITIEDVRECGYCCLGSKKHFEFLNKKYFWNISFRDFLNNGINIELFINTNDHMCLNVAEKTRIRYERWRGR